MDDCKKIDIRILTKYQLREIFVKKGLLSYRADQVYNWIWKKGVHSFDLMTNISKELRSFLELNFEINRVKFDISLKSIDGTIKNSVRLNDNNLVEIISKYTRLIATTLLNLSLLNILLVNKVILINFCE